MNQASATSMRWLVEGLSGFKLFTDISSTSFKSARQEHEQLNVKNEVLLSEFCSSLYGLRCRRFSLPRWTTDFDGVAADDTSQLLLQVILQLRRSATSHLIGAMDTTAEQAATEIRRIGTEERCCISQHVRRHRSI